MKNDLEILIILYDVKPMKSKLKDIIKKNTNLTVNKCFITKP